jgi:hypothetical protein
MGWEKCLRGSQRRRHDGMPLIERGPFDGAAGRPIGWKVERIGGGMDGSREELPERQTPTGGIPRLPRVWVGYLLGLATSVAEIVAIQQHPELLKGPLLAPPLYLFLPNFISLVYWLVCVYEYHKVLEYVTGGKYATKPLRAAWFHLIPIYGFYWAYRWPRELAKFVNARLNAPLMKAGRTGWLVSVAFFFFVLLDRGLGMILLFWAASYLSACLGRALQEPTITTT